MDFELETRNIETVKNIMKNKNATYSSVKEILHIENARLFMWYNTRINSLLLGSLDDEVINFYKYKNFTFGYNLYLWTDWCILLKEYLEKNNATLISDNECVNEYYKLGRWTKRQILNFRHLTNEQKEAFLNTKINCKWSVKTIEEAVIKTYSMTQFTSFDLEASNIQSVKEIMKKTNTTYDSVKKVLQRSYTDLYNWYNTRINSLITGTLNDEVINFYKYKNFTFGCDLYLWNDWCNLLKEYLEKNHTTKINDDELVNKHYHLGQWTNRQIYRFKYLTIEQQVSFVNSKIKFKWFPQYSKYKKVLNLNNTGLTIEEIISDNTSVTQYILEELSKNMAERDDIKITNVITEQLEVSKIKCIKKRLMKQMGSLYVEEKVDEFLKIAKPKYRDLILEAGSFPKISQLNSEDIKKYIRKDLIEWKLGETENNSDEESLLMWLYSFALVKKDKELEIKSVTWEVQFFDDERTYSAFYFDDSEKIFLSSEEIDRLIQFNHFPCMDIIKEYWEKKRIKLHKEQLIDDIEKFKRTLRNALENDNQHNRDMLSKLVNDLIFDKRFRWVKNTDKQLDKNINDNVCLIKKLICNYVDIEFINCFLVVRLKDAYFRPKLETSIHIIYGGTEYVFQEGWRVTEYNYVGYRILQAK